MFRFVWSLWLLGLMWGCSRPPAEECSPENRAEGDSVFVLAAGPLQMRVLRGGGRIASFTCAGEEVLSQPAAHELFGSTFWPSPQREWNWPPGAAFDSLSYAGGLTEDLVGLSSAIDPATGYQLRKTFRLNCNPARADITYELVNTSHEVRQVAAWEVTRVPGGGIAFFPGDIPADYPSSDLEWVTTSGGLVWFCCNPIVPQIGTKLFASGNEGWIAYARKGLLFIKLFPDITSTERPPSQGEVEIFARGDGSYLELENHGPFTTLAPGAHLTYPVTWLVHPIPDSMKVVSGNAELVRCARQIISTLHLPAP